MVLDLIKCLKRHICEILLLVLNCKVAIAQTCKIKATMKISDLKNTVTFHNIRYEIRTCKHASIHDFMSYPMLPWCAES